MLAEMKASRSANTRTTSTVQAYKLFRFRSHFKPTTAEILQKPFRSNYSVPFSLKSLEL